MIRREHELYDPGGDDSGIHKVKQWVSAGSSFKPWG